MYAIVFITMIFLNDVLIDKDMVDLIPIKEWNIIKGRALTLKNGAKDVIKIYLTIIKEHTSDD
jgi:hypothetical protein